MAIIPENIPFVGFAYDEVKAEAMADAIDATLNQAALAGVTVPDRLAALGIAVATVIVRSKLAARPDAAVVPLMDYVRAVVASLQKAASRARPPATPG